MHNVVRLDSFTPPVYDPRLSITNSAKLANIINAHRYNPILRPTEECVRIAVTGRIEGP
jgi:hypothetical protein